MAAIVVLIAVLSIITIFLFKKRKTQLLLSGILIGLVLGLILASCYYSYSVMSKYDATFVPGVKMALAFSAVDIFHIGVQGDKKG